MQFGWTALILACEYRHYEIVKLLLEHGANIDIRERVMLDSCEAPNDDIVA